MDKDERQRMKEVINGLRRYAAYYATTKHIHKSRMHLGGLTEQEHEEFWLDVLKLTSLIDINLL